MDVAVAQVPEGHEARTRHEALHRGIGRLKAYRMPAIKSAVELEMMRGLKRMLDPNNILNPGRVLPE